LSTLFTLSRSWHDSVWLFEQLAFASKGDAVLLMQDAVLAIHSPLSLGSFLAKCQTNGIAAYCLQEDASLRGVDNKYSQIKLIDYAGFVELVALHKKQVSW